jgi:hypothetical protein
MVLRSNVSYKWASDSCGHQNTCQNAFHIQFPLSSGMARRRVKNSNRDANFFAASLPANKPDGYPLPNHDGAVRK